LKTIITTTNTLPDMNYDDNVYLDPCAQIDVQTMRCHYSKFEYVITTQR